MSRRDIKRGAPAGFVVPARVEVAPLSGDERARLTAALAVLAPEVVTRIEYAILATVRNELTADSQPSEREVARELAKFAKKLIDFAEMIMPEAPAGPISTAREAAYLDIVQNSGKPLEQLYKNLTSVARGAAARAAALEMRASRKVRHPDPVAPLFISVRAALSDAGITASLPSDAEADTADNFPVFRASLAAALIVADRLKNTRRSRKFEEISNLSPLTVCRRIRRAIHAATAG